MGSRYTVLDPRIRYHTFWFTNPEGERRRAVAAFEEGDLGPYSRIGLAICHSLDEERFSRRLGRKIALDRLRPTRHDEVFEARRDTADIYCVAGMYYTLRFHGSVSHHDIAVPQARGEMKDVLPQLARILSQEKKKLNRRPRS